MIEKVNEQDVFTKIGDQGALGFYCPGCQQTHIVANKHSVENGTLTIGSNVWKWNGDKIRPSTKPSWLFTWGDDRVCHSFILNGEIHFLTDCTHELRGKFVRLEPPTHKN